MSKDQVTKLRGRTSARTVAGRYELRRLLGEGGMAEVHLATDLILERDVAVKLLRRHLCHQGDHADRFRREALALASINSRHVVPVHDSGVDGEDHYLVMRYVRGRTLAKVIATSGALPATRALRLAADVLDGLHDLHEKNVIHRDIKADNVLVDWDERASIADLGVSVDRTRPQLTPADVTLGTPSLMPPEQASTGHVDRRTDIYQVGLLLLHMLIGEAPVARDEPGLASQLALLPPALAAVISRALAPQLEHRWQTAAELKQALAALPPPPPPAFRADIEPPVPPPVLAVGTTTFPEQPAPRSASPRVSPVILIAAALAGVAIGLLVL